MRAVVLILLAFGALSQTRSLGQNTVDFRALGKDTVIIGQLGVPLGTVVEIDATVVAGSALRRKDISSEYLLKVSKVGSNAVADPPTCRFQTHSWDRVKMANDYFSLYALKTGKKAGSLSDSQIAELEAGYVGQVYRLVVYEVGGFSGIPHDLPKDSVVWQDHTFAFSTHLIVLHIVQEPAKPKPEGEANERSR